MRVDAFDFALPEQLIALRPVAPRHAARMLIVRPDEQPGLEDAGIGHLPEVLTPGDTLVLNDTRVIPARLTGVRLSQAGPGARIEVTLHQRLDPARWTAFARPARKLKPGDRIAFRGPGNACPGGRLDATVIQRGDGGEVKLAFDLAGAVLDEAIAANGEMPLPPYIATRRAGDERDLSDYQTVYGERAGAVAAPTAGLHFSHRLLDTLARRGIGLAHITLHVGAGTFVPVKESDTDNHRMYSEWGEISPATASMLNAARRAGRRVIAVGTTTLRVLETAVSDDGFINPWSGHTDIFITPGYKVTAVDGLLTNFHLPRSTLFMLVAAFCGLETMKRAYRHAIAEGYRFYSYGDASLLFPAAHVR